MGPLLEGGSRNQQEGTVQFLSTVKICACHPKETSTPGGWVWLTRNHTKLFCSGTQGKLYNIFTVLSIISRSPPGYRPRGDTGQSRWMPLHIVRTLSLRTGTVWIDQHTVPVFSAQERVIPPFLSGPCDVVRPRRSPGGSAFKTIISPLIFIIMPEKGIQFLPFTYIL